MYYIQKYADCWAIHNDDTGKSRSLTQKEVEAVRLQYPDLNDEKVHTAFVDQIISIDPKP
jgi:hypothetical protein